MHSLIQKLLLFLLFNLLLFLTVRLYELAAWYEVGFFARQLIDPVSLSVGKLKTILDVKGVNYEGVIEKKELVNLVGQLGEVLEEEMLMVQEEKEVESKHETTVFESKMHFYEEVEDKKDSLWLIQVIPPSNISLLSPKAWTTIRRKVSHFGIRTGTFDCSLDSKFCVRKNWKLPSLLLAMPYGKNYKDHVTMVHYRKRSGPGSILKWINAHLKLKITTLSHEDTAIEWMELAKHRPNHFPIRVVYFAEVDDPPLFYSSLNIKFNGRIKFAFVSTNQIEYADGQLSRNVKFKVPSIVVAMPEGTLHYGKRSGEFLLYNRLVVYLKLLSPEVNDAFVWSLICINTLCIFEFFITQGGILKRSFYLLWTVGKSNVIFLLFWLPFLGTLQLSFLESFWNFANKILRKILISEYACIVRSDILLHSNNTTFIALTFFFYCCIVGLVEQHRNRSATVQHESNEAWLRGVLQHYYMFLIRPSGNLVRAQLDLAHLETGLDMLIERLAVPDFWLHPIIQTDYISNLPTWKYHNFQESAAFISGNNDINATSHDANDITTSVSTTTEEHSSPASEVELAQEWPENTLSCSNCAICLDKYLHGDVLCGLPCRHCYHHICIATWLRRGHHNCPSCRWPAYRAKGYKTLKHQE